jgi:nicotinamide-nucleotide amidase
MNEHELSRQVEKLATSLLARNWRLATAESCTGGWIAKCCTDRAGSSTWFDRGYVTYSDESKIEMLKVEASALKVQGAVSETVVRQMALGARQSAAVAAALAVTGIAGPDGGSADKPVGTVWFAWSVQGLDIDSERVVFAGNRESVRYQTVMYALQGMWQRISQGPEK